MVDLSNRARITPPSPIRSLAPLAADAAARGIDILRLNIGQPDVHSPQAFFDGLQSYKEKTVAYESSEGSPALREAWTAYMHDELKLAVSPDELLVTMGASEALIFTFWACCDPGDQILILDPTYANYMGFAAVTGTELVPVHTELEDGFSLPPVAELKKHIGKRSRAVLLCNPNNPTGTVYDRQELEDVLELCHQHGLFLILDETYREIVYDGRKPLSLYQIDDKSNSVIIVDSLSKRFSLCGARLGCLFTKNKEIYTQVLNMAQARLAAPTIEQHAAAYMLTHLKPHYFEIVRELYESRRNILAAELSKNDDIDFHIPHGAFYGVAQLPIKDSVDFAKYLLSEFHIDNQTVFLAPASGFYMCDNTGNNKVRIAFVLEEEKLRRSVHILTKALREYEDT